MKRAIFCLLLLFPFFRSLAGTFTVTTNADSGPGSLRDILQQATANGSASFDTVLFNMPGGTEANRTITIGGTLILSSKLVIDGTSQPGSPFGISDTKVIIKRGSSFMCSGLYMFTLTNVELYGLWFKGFEYVFNLTGDCHQFTILMNQVTNVTIGKQGKGNAFSTSHPYTIWHKNYYGINIFVQDAFADTVQIGHNIFGLKDDASGVQLTTMNEGISLANGRNVTINDNIGNCAVMVGSATEENNGYIKFTNNNFANAVDPSQYGFGSFAVTKSGFTSSFVRYRLEVTGNKLTSATQYCIILWDMKGDIVIDNNELGAHYDMKPLPDESYGLAMIRCATTNATRITNNIIQNRKRGIWLGSCGRTFIGNNSIYCNSKGIYIQSTLAVPTVSITSINSGTLAGTTMPGSKVEVFFTDTCTSICENGKLSLGTTIANSNGDFSFPISNTGLYTATATSTDSITSEFNGVKVDTSHAVIKNATCGNNNGSITGIVIYNASSWYWENDLGQVISTSDTNLLNLPPGRYRLVLQETNSACSVITGFYEVLQFPQPVITGNPFTITHPSCGQSNGKVVFTGTRPPGSVNKWLDNAGNLVQLYGDSIINLSPGQYFFKLYLYEDTACFSVYGPFVLTNNSGPSLQLGNVQITNTTCGNPHGSITGITATNVTGTAFIQWVNASNTPVGASLNLTNVQAGSYRMKFKDQSGCDTIITNFYVITDAGKITIDTTGKIVRPAGCTVSNGSIENISVTGADTYQWQNLSTGSSAGNTVSLFNLSAGNYQLTATNALGCSATSPVIVVAQSAFMPIAVQSVQFNHATCSQQNGSITITAFTSSPASYTFRWVDSATSQVLSTGFSLTNLGAGTYLLIATDINGCEKEIYKRSLLAYAKPVVDLTGISITHEQCSQKNGSISGILVTGLLGPTTYSWTDQGNVPAGNNLFVSNLGTGQYKLTVNDGPGCLVESPWIMVNNNDITLAPPLYDDQTVNNNSPAILSIRNFQNGTYIIYKDAGAGIEIGRNTTGLFTTGRLTSDTVFYIKRLFGSCGSTLTPVKVKVIKRSDVYVPGAFTPNGDGKNDVLKPVAVGPLVLQYFYVYNVYGQLVFSSSDFTKGWDGTINGKRSDGGTYTWVLKAYDEVRHIYFEQKGTSILIR